MKVKVVITSVSILEYEIQQLDTAENILNITINKEEFKKDPFKDMKNFTFTLTMELKCNEE